MTRFSAITILVLAASIGLARNTSVILTESIQQQDKEKDKDKEKPKVHEKDFELKGKFTDKDSKDRERKGPSQTHLMKMKAGQTYTIEMRSSAVDSFLRILDSKGEQLDEDDDSGGDQDSLIVFKCSKDGEYKIVCTTFDDQTTVGDYTLSVKTAKSPAPQDKQDKQDKPAAEKPAAPTSHGQLIGKPAPDFKGNFALNGQPVKLSDLKGKVVLLAFWEVRSPGSVALLPQLSDWHKAHKDEGLAVVGVTYFPSEIGQKLILDKETGKLKDDKQADLKTDQMLFKDFAEYYKVDHLLMALAKQDALSTFDAYAVNGLPQIVLIDRKGMIRMIHVSGLKNSSNIEEEFKKLLAEK